MRILSLPLALLLFFGVAPAFAQNTWTTVAEQVKRSTVFVQIGEQGSCTGFIINDKAKGGEDKKDDVDYILTAAHCDGSKLWVGGAPAIVKSKDSKKDLMVVEVENLNKPALRLAAKDPEVGDEVASFGFGYGLEDPMFRVANVAAKGLYIPHDGIGGPFISINASFVPGQSGGPVLNHAGEIVMVVQLGTPVVGFGVGAEIIQDKVGRFFSQVP